VVEVLSPEGYELATLEAGIPRFGIDTNDKTLPPELGPHFESNHVSYTKGCYTGQEVLMRMHSRGHTNKTWVGLKASAPISPGTRVSYEGKDVGTVHRAALSPAFGHIASATLRNEATAEGTKVQAGDTAAEVVTMPFLRQTSP
jgi:folate-binding protein YgfZ